MTHPETNQPEPSAEQLIQLLQSGESAAISDDMLAALSDDQRQHFLELRHALQLLEDGNPDFHQAAVDSALIGEDSTPGQNEPLWTTENPTPKQLGHYEVLETLARGGFGVVLKARDTKLGRLVALKIPRLESLMSGAKSRERFVREARLVAMLGHPAIVPVYETGADGSILFIASAFCNGGTLGHWYRDRQKKIDPQLAARIVARLAEGVQHAHARGVIHRDLKPGNVLLHFADGEQTEATGDDLVDALRIADFGLARFTASDQQMTQTGATIGTPAYMSPEQARGLVNQIDERSDIYALGAILYELLAGKPPILGESNLATMRAVETEVPVSPEKADASVPRDLSAICMKCLEKDAANRYTDAQRLQDDLASFLNGRSVTARPAGKLTQLSRWCKRNPAMAAMLVLLFFSMAAGLGLTTWQWRNAQNNLAESQRQGGRAVGHLQRAEQAIDDMLTDVADSLRNVPHMTPLRERLLLRALELQQEILEAEQDELASLRTAHAHRRIGKIQMELGKPEMATGHYAKALAALDQIPADGAEQAELLLEQGRLHRLSGHALYGMQRSDSTQSAKAAIALLNAAEALEFNFNTRIELSSAYRLLGMSLQRERQAAEAVAAFDKSVQLLAGMEEFDGDHLVHSELSRAHNSLAIGQKAIGQMDAAVENYQASIRVAGTALETEPDNVELQGQMATTALNLGNLLYSLKDYESALEYYEQSTQNFEQLAGDFPGVPRYLRLASMASNGMGIACRRRDPPDPEMAAEKFQHAIDLLLKKEDQFGLTADDRNELVKLYGNLGSITEKELDHRADGRRLQRISIEISRGLADEFPERPSYWWSLSMGLGNLAVSMMDQGEAISEAREMLAEARDAGLKAWQANPKNPSFRSNVEWQIRQLALANVRLGQFEQARDLALEWIDQAPDDAAHYRFSITMLAGLIDNIVEAPDLNDQQMQLVQQQMADWAIDLIVIAQDKGLIQSNKLNDAGALTPLRSRERFQQVIGR